MALRCPFEIIVSVLIYLFLDKQEVSEHPLLKLNEPFEFFVIDRESTDQILLTLRFECANCQIVCLYYLVKLKYHRFAVSLGLTQITFIVVDIVFVAAAEHLS